MCSYTKQGDKQPQRVNTMQTFKRGDRVRAIQNSRPNRIVRGEEYEVEGVFTSKHSANGQFLDLIDKNGEGLGVMGERFELVKAAGEKEPAAFTVGNLVRLKDQTKYAGYWSGDMHVESVGGLYVSARHPKYGVGGFPREELELSTTSASTEQQPIGEIGKTVAEQLQAKADELFRAGKANYRKRKQLRLMHAQLEAKDHRIAELERELQHSRTVRTVIIDGQPYSPSVPTFGYEESNLLQGLRAAGFNLVVFDDVNEPVTPGEIKRLDDAITLSPDVKYVAQHGDYIVYGEQAGPTEEVVFKIQDRRTGNSSNLNFPAEEGAIRAAKMWESFDREDVARGEIPTKINAEGEFA